MENPLWRERLNTGGPTVAHHIQCVDGRGGPSLGVLGSGTGGGGGSSNNYGNNSQLVGGQYVKGTASDGKRRRGMHS